MRERVGEFAVGPLLGEGSMARVYRVTDASGAAWALTVLAGGGAARAERLRREGRVLVGLRHPNVVRVREVVDVDGQPGVVMELVDGPDLGARLAAAPLTVGQVDALARGILAGVAAAHAEGLVHGDLKPSNVLLARVDDGLVPKVADFGLAEDRDATAMTRTGVLLGTRGHVAPEQALDAARADARSDVYALGALIDAMCTGTPPRGGRSLGPIDGVPSCEPLAERRPELGAARIAAVTRALSPHPGDRFADASAFLAAWTAEPALPVRWPGFDLDPTTSSPAPGLAPYFREVWGRGLRRNRLLAGATVAVVGALAAVALTSMADAPPSQAAMEVLAKLVITLGDQVGEDETLAMLAESEALAAALPQVRPWRGLPYIRGRILSAEGRYRDAVAAYEAAGADLVDAGGELRNRYGDALLAAGDLDAAEAAYEAGLATHLDELGRDHAEVGEALADLGRLRTAQGRPGEAIPLLREAVALRSATVGPERNLTVEVRGHLCEALHKAGADDAVACLDALRGDARAAATVDRLDIDIALAEGRLDDAKALAERRIAALGRRESDRLWSFYYRGIRAEVALARGDAGAERTLVALRRSVLARVGPRSVFARRIVALVGEG